MLSAAWRQIFEDAWAENGKSIVEVSESMDDKKLSGVDVADLEAPTRQHWGPAATRSQWRLRKTGISWKAQNRWVLIRALKGQSGSKRGL